MRLLDLRTIHSPIFRPTHLSEPQLMSMLPSVIRRLDEVLFSQAFCHVPNIPHVIVPCKYVQRISD